MVQALIPSVPWTRSYPHAGVIVQDCRAESRLETLKPEQALDGESHRDSRKESTHFGKRTSRWPTGVAITVS